MNDHQQRDSAATPNDQTGGSRGRLLRSRGDRMLAGVAGGLGEHFGVDPILFRIAFVITTFVGGLGVIAYLAIYVFVPTTGATGNPVQADDRSRLIAAVVAFLLLTAMSGGFFPFSSLGTWWGITWLAFWAVILAAVAYGAFTLWQGFSDPDRSSRNDHGREDAVDRTDRWSPGRVLALAALVLALLTLASVLAVLGAWLAVATGTAVIAVTAGLALILLIIALVHRPSRWLVVPALALGVPLIAVQASGIEIRGGYGDRLVTPVSAGSIPDEGYRLAAGDLTVDLRSLDWDSEPRVDLEVVMGIGRASVVVPSEVCVSALAEAKVGEVNVRGDSEAGIGVAQRIEPASQATPVLELDGSVEIGQFQVLTELPGLGDEAGRQGTEPQPRECFEPEPAGG